MSLLVLKNTAWGFIGEFVVRIAKIAQVILIARILGSDDLGRFNYAMAFASMFSVLFDFGIVPIAIKSLAADPSGGALLLFGRLKILMSSIGLVLLAISVAFFSAESEDSWITFGMGVFLAFSDLSSYTAVAYRARNEFWRETLLRSVMSISQLLICGLTLILTKNLEVVVFALVITSCLGVIPLLVEWSRPSHALILGQNWNNIRNALYQSAPIALSILAGSVYMNFDVVMLAKYASMQEVGWFTVAVKAIFAMAIMPLHYLQLATLPLFSSKLAVNNSTEETFALWIRSYLLSSIGGALIGLLIAVLAEPLILVLFGGSYIRAVPLLVIFTIAGFMFYIYTPLSQWLLLQGRQQITLYIQVFAMALNIVAVIFFVKYWGVWGAVGASLLTHSFIALMSIAMVFRDKRFRNFMPEIKGLISVFVALITAIFIIYIEIGGSILSKILALIIFTAIARYEIKLFFLELQIVWNQYLLVK